MFVCCLVHVCVCVHSWVGCIYEGSLVLVGGIVHIFTEGHPVFIIQWQQEGKANDYFLNGKLFWQDRTCLSTSYIFLVLTSTGPVWSSSCKASPCSLLLLAKLWTTTLSSPYNKTRGVRRSDTVEDVQQQACPHTPYPHLPTTPSVCHGWSLIQLVQCLCVSIQVWLSRYPTSHATSPSLSLRLLGMFPYLVQITFIFSLPFSPRLVDYFNWRI